MNNYFTLLLLAFDTNPVKATLYSLPSLLFLTCGLFLIISMIWLDLKEKKDPNVYQNGAGGAILILFGLIFVIIGCFSIPQFHWLKLNFTSGQPIVMNLYNNKISAIEDNPDFVYNLMFDNFPYDEETNKKFMNFIIQNTPKGVVIQKSDIKLLLQKNHLLYVNCMIDSKNKILSTLQSKDMTVPDVNEYIDSSISKCKHFVLHDIATSYLKSQKIKNFNYYNYDY